MSIASVPCDNRNYGEQYARQIADRRNRRSGNFREDFIQTQQDNSTSDVEKAATTSVSPAFQSIIDQLGAMFQKFTDSGDKLTDLQNIVSNYTALSFEFSFSETTTEISDSESGTSYQRYSQSFAASFNFTFQNITSETTPEVASENKEKRNAFRQLMEFALAGDYTDAGKTASMQDLSMAVKEMQTCLGMDNTSKGKLWEQLRDTVSYAEETGQMDKILHNDIFKSEKAAQRVVDYGISLAMQDDAIANAAQTTEGAGWLASFLYDSSASACSTTESSTSAGYFIDGISGALVKFVESGVSSIFSFAGVESQLSFSYQYQSEWQQLTATPGSFSRDVPEITKEPENEYAKVNPAQQYSSNLKYVSMQPYNPMYDETLDPQQWLEPVKPKLDADGNAVLDAQGRPVMQLSADHMAWPENRQVFTNGQGRVQTGITSEKVYPGGDGNYYNPDGTFACTEDGLQVLSYATVANPIRGGVMSEQNLPGIGHVAYGQDGYLYDDNGDRVTQAQLESANEALAKEQEEMERLQLMGAYNEAGYKFFDDPENQKDARRFVYVSKDKQAGELAQDALVKALYSDEAKQAIAALEELDQRYYEDREITKEDYLHQRAILENKIINQEYDDGYSLHGLSPESTLDNAILRAANKALEDGREDVARQILQGYQNCTRDDVEQYAFIVSELAGVNKNSDQEEARALLNNLGREFPQLQAALSGSGIGAVADATAIFNSVFDARMEQLQENDPRYNYLERSASGWLDNVPTSEDGGYDWRAIDGESDPMSELMALASRNFHLDGSGDLGVNRYASWVRNDLISQEAYDEYVNDLFENKSQSLDQYAQWLDKLDLNNPADQTIYNDMRDTLENDEGSEANFAAFGLLNQYFMSMADGVSDDEAMQIALNGKYK